MHSLVLVSSSHWPYRRYGVQGDWMRGSPFTLRPMSSQAHGSAITGQLVTQLWPQPLLLPLGREGTAHCRHGPAAAQTGPATHRARAAPETAVGEQGGCHWEAARAPAARACTVTEEPGLTQALLAAPCSAQGLFGGMTGETHRRHRPHAPPPPLPAPPASQSCARSPRPRPALHPCPAPPPAPPPRPASLAAPQPGTHQPQA